MTQLNDRLVYLNNKRVICLPIFKIKSYTFAGQETEAAK